MKILVLEDDRFFADYLNKALSKNHYAVDCIGNGDDALSLLQYTYDLLILDLELPDTNGISFCKKLRDRGNNLPVLMLTASQEQIIIGLDSGADDYLLKPCKIDELLARIRALLRRGNTNHRPILSWGNLSLDPATAIVRYQSKEIKLRPKEYQLLELFLRNPKRIFSRDAILNHLWTIEETPTHHAVTNLIKDTRKRLQKAGMNTEMFETVHGVGYRLYECGSRSSLEKIQAKFLSTLDQKIEFLGQTIELKLNKQLEPDREELGRQIAHQLAGSLGSFGFPDATPIIRSIEIILKDSTEPDDRLESLFQELKAVVAKAPVQIAVNNVDPLATLLLATNNMTYADRFYGVSVSSDLRVEVVDPEEVESYLTMFSVDIVLICLENDRSLELLSEIRAVCQQPIVALDFYPPGFERRIEVAKCSPDRYFYHDSLQDILASVRGLLNNQRQYKILILDDDQLFNNLVLELLRSDRLKVKTIDAPILLLEELRREKPDLLILDFDLPQFNGLEICQMLRQDDRFKTMPVLFLTAYNNLTSELFAAGADDVVSKSVVSSELLPRVWSKLDRLKS